MPGPTRGLAADRDRLAGLAAGAAARLGASDHLVRAGPVTLRVRVIGSTLAPRVLPALAGLVDDTTAEVPDEPEPEPVATITVWDMAEADRALPALGLLPRPDEAPRTTYLATGDGTQIESWFQPLESTISLFDHGHGQGWYCVRDASVLPPWESAAPLRALLRWALADHDLHLVHAASVGHNGRGLLLAARGGSGKSTSTALAAVAGMETTGDDYVVLHAPPGGVPTVYALYRPVKLHAEVLATRYPDVRSVEAGHGKRSLWLDDLAPGSLVGRLEVAGVLVPHVAGLDASEFRSADPATAVRGLGPSTVFQLPGRPGPALRAMGALAEQVPVFDAALGRDLDRVPGELAQLLDDLVAAGSAVGA